MVRSESKSVPSQRLLASKNCAERAEFEDDSAASLAASGSKSLNYTFYSGQLTSPSLAIVTRVKLYRSIAKKAMIEC